MYNVKSQDKVIEKGTLFSFLKDQYMIYDLQEDSRGKMIAFCWRYTGERNETDERVEFFQMSIVEVLRHFENKVYIIISWETYYLTFDS